MPGGAAILLIITRAHVEKVLQEVDRATLLFFAGLFVVVDIIEVDLWHCLLKILLGITGGEPWVTFHFVIWMSAIASAFIDIIPFTATMVPIIDALNLSSSINSTFGNLSISPLWWALALGADLGGNGTLLVLLQAY